MERDPRQLDDEGEHQAPCAAIQLSSVDARRRVNGGVAAGSDESQSGQRKGFCILKEAESARRAIIGMKGAYPPAREARRAERDGFDRERGGVGRFEKSAPDRHGWMHALGLERVETGKQVLEERSNFVVGQLARVIQASDPCKVCRIYAAEHGPCRVEEQDPLFLQRDLPPARSGDRIVQVGSPPAHASSDLTDGVCGGESGIIARKDDAEQATRLHHVGLGGCRRERIDPCRSHALDHGDCLGRV